MKNYQKLTSELDIVLDELQSGTLSLDDAIARYEKGMQLVSDIQEQLKLAENKITKIQASFKEEK